MALPRAARQLSSLVLLSSLLLLFAMTNSARAASEPPLDCPGASDTTDWQRYADLVLDKDGRVRDTGNGGISHSEGQGFGMRLAFHYKQRDDFARIWQWTQEHLYVRGDQLAAWRWRPDADPHIDDKNNATDGDLFIAWSLALAGRCWNEPDYLATARQIAADIRAKLIRHTKAGALLLPGAEGFEHGETLTLNPSYWVFPALAELARLEQAGSPEAAKDWRALIESGAELLDQLRFGRWQLPPDWVTWSEADGFSLPDQFPPRFSYDAVRVPLYWIWHGQAGEPIARIGAYWQAQQQWSWRSDWVDLKTDALSSNPAPLGIASIAALTRFAATNTGDDPGVALLRFEPLPGGQAAVKASGLEYYSASLRLFAAIAGEAWCRQSCASGQSHCLGGCGNRQ